MRPATRFLIWICLANLFGGSAIAADEAGSKDHPLVGRYQGSSIVFYKTSGFDEAALLGAPHDAQALLDRNVAHDRSGAEWLKLEGKVTKIRYEIPEGRSSLEVMRNYEAALRSNGFTPVFNCADQACFVGNLRDPYLLGQEVDVDNGVSTLYFDRARYLLARLSRPEGDVYAAILVGEDKQRVTAFVEVVETKPMESGKIQVLDAGQIGDALARDGRVALYGILFDYDKDTLRPESRPTLAEVAKAMAAKPALKIEVVGHTDDKGTAAYNLDLSRRRAARVVAALANELGVASSRMTSSGAGQGSPVAPNDSDENRAKNRRVEIVSR